MQPGSERLGRSIAAAAAVLAGTIAEDDAAIAANVAAELTAHLDALAGEAVFADMPSALREAELQALQITLSVFEAGLPKDDGEVVSASRAFHIAAVQYSATELAMLAAARGAHGLRRIKRASSEIAAPRSLAEIRVSVEEALLIDLDLAIGPERIPERFLVLFLDRERRGTSWFDAFALYVAWYIRSDAGLGASLAEAPASSLDAVGLDMPALLERLFARSKDTALRHEAGLAEAEAAGVMPEDQPNAEVAAYLAALPQQIAGQLRVPPEPLVARLTAHLGSHADVLRLPERMARDAERLGRLLARLEPAPDAAPADLATRARAIGFIASGQIAEAAAVIASLPASPPRAWMLGACSALAGDWAEARTHLNRTIESVAGDFRQLGVEAAVDLAEALARAGSEVVRATALDVCRTLMASREADLGVSLRARALLVCADLAIEGFKPPRLIGALTFVAGALAELDISDLSELDDLTKARICRARGDVAAALASQGADRLREAADAYREGLVHAAVAGSVRLQSELQARQGDLLLRQAKVSSATAAPAFRIAAHEAYRAALVPGLRAHDPIWWSEIKLAIAESALVIGSASGDAALLRDAVIDAKAALRLSAYDILPPRPRHALGIVGDGFAALARAEPARSWRSHALASYEQAVGTIDADRNAAVWAQMQIKIAGFLMPEPGEQDVERIDTAVACYRAALGRMKQGTVQTLRIERHLAEALARAGRGRLEPARLVEAAGVYRGIVAAAAKLDTALWSRARIELADALYEVARLNHDLVALDEAISGLLELISSPASAGQNQFAERAKAVLSKCRELRRSLSLGGRSPAPEAATVGRLGRVLRQA